MTIPEPIAIVGMQCLFPGAGDLEAYWRNIVRGVDSIRDIPPSRWNPDDYDLLPLRRGGFIEGLTSFDPLEHGIMPAAVEQGDPEQFLVFAVIHGALRDVARGRAFHQSGTSTASAVEESLTTRTELVIGRGGYSGSTVETAYLRLEFVTQMGELLARLVPGASPSLLKEIRQLLATAFPARASTEMLASSIPNLTSGRVSNRLDFQGGNYTVDGACASGLLATDLVMRALRERRCDVGIAAAVQLVQKPYFWFAFELLQALSPSGACRVYSRAADGLVIGEGLGAVVLKRLADAQRDGDRIYAILRAVGTASDGRGAGLLSPRREGQVLAIRRAYQECGVDLASIRLLEGHGTAMPVGDATEIATLHEVFGQEGPALVPLGSVKSMIGHLMPAAGMAGLIKTALAVYHRVWPPTLHVEEVHPELRESRFFVNTRCRPWIAPLDEPRRAGVNAFGFGGINTHAILEDVVDQQPRESLTPRSSELIVLTASSRRALEDKLATWLRVLPSWSEQELRDVAYTASLRFDGGPVRLAIVATDMGDLKRKLERARTRLGQDSTSPWNDEPGITFADAPYPGKVAFLFPGLAFPGLGAGYTERLGELCLHFPEVRHHLDFAEGFSRFIDSSVPYPLSHQFFPPPLADARTLARLERELIWSKRTSLAQMLVAVATGDLLTAAGVKADVLAGFSLGEWGALLAAGVLTHDELREMHVVWQSLGDVPEQLAGLWGMVGASADKVEAVLERVPGTVAIIMDPSPTQTFFAGEAEAVRTALDLLRRDGVFVQEIPFPAIHTPLAAPIVEGLRAMKSAMPAHPPRARVYCGMTGQPYPDDPDTIRDWLIDSFKEPLRGRETLQNLYHQDGVRIFIELGIGGRIPQSLANVLDGAPHVALSVDSRGDSGLEQFHQLLGRLAVLGVPFDLGYLFRRRPCRELDLTSTQTPAKQGIMLDLRQPRVHVPEESLARLREILTPTRRVEPRSPVGDVMATMERFLQVQQQHEAAETQILSNFLAAQQAAMESCLAGLGNEKRHTHERNASAPSMSPYAFRGEVLRLVPGKELETHLLLDVGKHVFLEDHAFIKVPESIKPVEERLPTLPMTFGLEIIAETAAQLVPDMQVIDCHDIEANRWIALISQRTLPLTIRARRLSETEVDVEVRCEDQDRPALRGKVALGSTFPPAPASREVSYDRPCAHRAEEVYSIPLFFHGPRFFAISRFIGTSDSTIVSELTLRDPRELFAGDVPGALLFDPVLLDGVGQTVGYKLLLDDWVTYPLRLGRLMRFGPTPPPGSVVRVLARYRRIDGRRAEFEADVLDPSGRVWLRAENWQIWRILWPRELATFSRQPRQHRVGIPWPTRHPGADCCRMMARRCGEISPDWIARYCLPAREWAIFKARPRFDWLLQRIALKDAVRDWLKQHTNEAPLHLEIEIADGADGHPIVVTPAIKGLEVSVAGVEDEAIAVAVRARAAGVDMAIRTANSRNQVLRDEEAMLTALGGDLASWKQRAICARNALARALKVSVESWPISRIGSDGVVTIRTSQGEYEVETSMENDRVFAVAILTE